MKTQHTLIPFPRVSGMVTRRAHAVAVCAFDIVSGPLATELIKSKMRPSRDRVPDQHER